MPTLVVPTTAVHRSFLEAWDELEPHEERWMGASGLGKPDRSRTEVEDPEVFAQLVEEILAEADEDTELPADLVHQTVLWFVDGDQWLGRLSIRHRLTPHLLELGGHIGYVVRPSARRKGYATQMLVQSLPYAARLGIDPALVTCDTDNDPSRKVIESAGGELEDERHGKLRFWVPTHVS
ncbi:putative acetyltransferase [Kribbella sp. VKM Ac-2527]|uniref:Putative acetyltransferase n=1 Tax=Kribbella caucasensis TaxID=2512215 RepID=A0A4R6K6C6_9ACTN|nr:GNAT family N-acetyltransferase [Kribbella sp. VKM Ac-2527]TDO44930.1 putative acetyltransferase [Kribbella sp. VKM Ac-2527]